ncbi:DUF1883 domain-containing protein [Microbacterium sp. Root553]|uniref:DUF1883 domain-containing protein n=1 Tax=Microbacterium sp. Root553 TaxID=1736556 RepID=UPI0006FAC97A|nr:DUF1883 domain-containing protein [Microbacterium sp. Root553]KQZ23775.1 hypothetical protein ASD43_04955 [Microbacterium sp. Root553]
MPAGTFQRYDLGTVNAGSEVSVTLSTGANVRLMTSTEFQNYRAGRAHRYYGGLARRSPLKIAVPHTDHWYVTVDLNGLAARTVTTSVQVNRAS